MYDYAEVIIAFAKVEQIDRVFTYSIPEHLRERIQAGCRVKVPFGKGSNQQIGYVMRCITLEHKPEYRVKPIIDILDQVPILGQDQLELVTFMVEYYGATYAAAIDAIIPPGMKLKPLEEAKHTVNYIRLCMAKEDVIEYVRANAHKKPFAKQKLILEYLLERGDMSVPSIQAQVPSPSSSLKTLITKGYIEKYEQEEQLIHQPIVEEKFRVLNEEQRVAFNKIIKGLNTRQLYTVLLDGITGSGKTEVFLHVIKKVLDEGGRAIVLVPEIALTDQTLGRFKERFGSRVALTHSRMSIGERQRLYMRAKKGEVDIVIGARSAIFAPLKNLRLIVIDEEHETTYKSESYVKYNAIDVAKFRMEKVSGTVILASATPSMEAYRQSEEKIIETAYLTKRAGDAKPPIVELVDMRQELAGGNPNVVSRILHEGICETLQKGQQVMLLLNRRGHSTFISCRSCGYVIKCDHCDIAMTYHMRTEQLICHHCGKVKLVPKTCPECESPYIRFFGNGTQKVEAYLNEHFADYGVIRMDFDTTSGKEGHAKLLHKFRQQEANILIGTQMIAKGHDFEKVTLVGVIAADASLYIEDFRSEERTFQLLTQIVGRSGRGRDVGRVLIQSYNPENIVLERVKYHQKALFYKEELQTRKLMGYPPYTHLFTLLITGKDEKAVINGAHMLMQYYKHYNRKKLFRIIGPVPANISKIADEYRWQITIIGEDREKILIYGKFCLNKFIKHEITDTIKINWDIDPLNMN